MHYFPLAFPFLALFFALFLGLIVFVEVGVLRYVYGSIGVSHRFLFALILLSLLGSYVNIPVARLPAEHIETGKVITYFGVRHVVPMVVDWPGTIIAVNLGGAVVPTLVSVYLVWKNRLYWEGPLAVAAVAYVAHELAHPVPGLGIAEPVFIPPLISAVVVVLVSRRRAAPLAYAAGSLGTLIGADLLNLGKINGLGAPIASIGGAGTFDGIFLSGILTVLLASFMTRRQEKPQDAASPGHGALTPPSHRETKDGWP
ncbi:MAG: DUF1614 domain-containing protein [bacterium]